MADIPIRQIEEAILERLTRPYNIENGRIWLLIRELKKEWNGPKPGDIEFQEAIWRLINRGLLFWEIGRQHGYEKLYFTGAGRKAATGEDPNPYKPDHFFEWLNENVPHVSELVLLYTREAVNSFNSECYLAVAVMTGVASEAAFHELLDAFLAWLPDSEKAGFEREARKDSPVWFDKKFTAFRKRLESHKSDLPADLADGLDLTLNSVIDLLRIYRNDAGHPKGRILDRNDAYINLTVFARYLVKMYALKSFFEMKNSDE